MAATVHYPNGRTRQVRNLSWLTKSGRLADVVDVVVRDATKPAGLRYELGYRDTSATFYLADGSRFVGVWADRNVLRRWLSARRALNGVTVDWLRSGVFYLDRGNFVPVLTS